METFQNVSDKKKKKSERLVPSMIVFFQITLLGNDCKKYMNCFFSQCDPPVNTCNSLSNNPNRIHADS